MSFDKDTRNLLAKTVAACRRRLVEDVTDQLRGVFGLHPDGTVLPLEKLTHLSPDQHAAASRLRDLLDHYIIGAAGNDSDRRKVAYERMVLEISFTVLNRLAALRLCEERGLVVECVRKGTTSAGFQMFERISGGALGGRYDTYKIFLECLFDELALDLGVLFDRMTPQSAVFPSEHCMEEVLAELNKADLMHLWAEDETIGWVYQYFNPPEERKAMREASQTPRNSRELAVRNQFFTPRYVVEFLTDNTLGRVWYEMLQSDTTLKEECRYLVRRPDEVFLSVKTGAVFDWLHGRPVEKEPELVEIAHSVNGYLRAGGLHERAESWFNLRLEKIRNQKAESFSTQEILDFLFILHRADRFCNGTVKTHGAEIEELTTALKKRIKRSQRDDLSQEESIRLPTFIPLREIKDPREIKVLDPACGSGHFLLYTFELLEKIYLEAWQIEKQLEPEIFYRSTHLKPLQKTYSDKSQFIRDIPRLIIEYNLYGIDIDPRAVQIAALALWLRAQKSWKNLGLKAPERPRIARSNIVTAEPMPGEEDMRREFTAGLKPPVLGQIVDEVFEKMKLAGEAGSLLKIEEEIKNAVVAAGKQWRESPKPEQRLIFPTMEALRPKQQELRFDVKGITDERFWEQAEDRILDALQEYAERAENGRAVRRRLFVEDAARGFAFINLCRKRYDVVLMNPPFGEVSPDLSDYLAHKYPSWNKNVLCAFIEHGYKMSSPYGAVAAIYDRTAIIKSTYEDFRKTILMADNRLCTMADLGWGVLDANVEVTTSVLHHIPASAEGAFFDCREIGIDNKDSFLEELIDNFSAGLLRNGSVCVRGASFYHLPNAVIGYDFPGFLIAAFGSFPSLENSGFKAHQGFALKAERHFRVWWEIPSVSHMVVNRMFNGAGFAPFVATFHDVAISGVEPEDLPMDSSTRKSGIGSHRKMGICFGKRGDFFCTHVLPKGHIFTVEGQSIPIANKDKIIEVLALLNTPLVRFSLNKYCGQHKYSGYVNLFPYRRLANIEGCRARVESTIEAIRNTQRLDETQLLFSRIELGNGISNRASLISQKIEATQALRSDTETFCHEQSIITYKLSNKARAEIEAFRARQPTAESPISDVDLGSGANWFSAHSEVSLALGIVFGRWDIRFALDPSLAPKLPDPFDALPVCPAGMLADPDGLPAIPHRIVSKEWLRARPDANTLPPESSVKTPIISDSDYPLRISWDGILVDDPGFNSTQTHRDDIVRRVREVGDLLWKDKAHEMEQEACDILGASDLRDYFRKPAGFFQDHLKRYSKSRRKAPIYWPLSTASGSYTIWLYYHRLNDQTLYGAVNKYVEPKIAETERGIACIQNELEAASGRDAARLTDQLNETRMFLVELRDLREELLQIAALPYKPNLNDGVIINAAPFHKLFRLRSWAKDTEDCWKKLEKGDYDWAHLAYTIWPQRVREICKRDRSIAIAHGLDDVYEVAAPAAKKRTRRKKTE